MDALGGCEESPTPTKVSATSAADVPRQQRARLENEGAPSADLEDWWLIVGRDGERVVDDHPVRVVADSELAEVLAAVVTVLE